MDLRYDMNGSDVEGEKRHPMTVMRDLGIIYGSAEPQPIAEQWLFFDCSSVPENLPPYINELKNPPWERRQGSIICN